MAAPPPPRIVTVGRQPVIDYLTKDYAGFRQAMLDQIPLRLPAWKDRSESDFGVVLIELFAYVADILSYYQDRVANEAYLATKELGPDKFEIVVPSVSILAEPPVTVVDKNVDKKGTRKVAEEYLSFLYSPEGQEIAGKHFYRPRDPKVAEKYKAQFSPVKLFTIDEVFGGWSKAQKTHFDDGGVFDQIYGSKS